MLSYLLTTVAAWTSPLLAQVDAAPERSDWFGPIAAGVLIVGVVVASIRSSGRSHQD